MRTVTPPPRTRTAATMPTIRPTGRAGFTVREDGGTLVRAAAGVQADGIGFHGFPTLSDQQLHGVGHGGVFILHGGAVGVDDLQGVAVAEFEADQEDP